MKVTNNRAKSATLFYKVQGKMNKVRLKPFESLSIAGLTDINAVRNNMVISNFVASDRQAYNNTLTATTGVQVVTKYTFNDGLSVSPLQFIDTGITYTQGNFAANPTVYSGTPQATFSRRKIPVLRQVRGRFEIKYI